MSKGLLEVIAIMCIALPIGLIAVRYYFKGSILYLIGSLWLTSWIILDVVVNLKFLYPKIFPAYLTTPAIILMGIWMLSFIARKVRKPLDESISALQKISEGDLRVSIEKDTTHNDDELGKLKKALKDLTHKLNEVIEGITTAAQELESSGSQVSASSIHLSQMSSEQAATLEEISSSMEEIVSSIHQNADNALQTEKIANATSKNLEEGVASTNIALDSLNNIAQKITIINDIAFQTNLLALNAAVEAARAGEHGRGFAVVAGEVKKLADKSKDAAGTINEVSSATMIMSKSARRELEALVPEIEKTAQLINEIASANMEQSSSVEHINNAMQQLNVVVQNNAQRSDELALHSKELSVQADELQNLIAEFKL